MSRLRDAAERAARRLGYDLVPRGPVSPVPEVPPEGDWLWSRRSRLPLDLDAQLALIEGPLRPHLSGLRDFDLWNGLFQAGDAEVLYALIRHLRPARIAEIGCGHSTLVTAAACEANARDGAPAELLAVDPEPRIEVPVRVERVDCRDVPAERFERLRDGDVLFVDTWHVVKLGAEVNWIVLDLLPRLAPGVWVHFHDVFLPYEYPRWIFTTAGYLNEQYLLEAFLLGGEWTVELAMAALFRDRHERLTAAIPSLREPVPGVPELRTWPPSSFWLRRTSG